MMFLNSSIVSYYSMRFCNYFFSFDTSNKCLKNIIVCLKDILLFFIILLMSFHKTLTIYVMIILPGYNKHKVRIQHGDGLESTLNLELGKPCVIEGRTQFWNSLMWLRFCAYDDTQGGQSFGTLHVTDCNGDSATASFHTGNTRCLSLEYHWTGKACYVT